ncbi:MAG: methylated-DNA--[protein]-cysteine S-methyltransferase [Pseudomonadota bacterium]
MSNKQNGQGKRYSVMRSPVGDLILVTGAGGLEQVCFTQGKGAREVDPAWIEDVDALAAVRLQLEEYFAGRRRDFDLTLLPQGTDFQKAVWQALTAIPFGETRSYAQIAEQIGRPKAVRAVGAANGANPLPIVVPCHRVIGASGKLTGFGGGLPAKQHLLALEGAGVAAEPQPA